MIERRTDYNWDDYFEWMYDMMCRNRFAKSISYRKLFKKLDETEFYYSIIKDENRACDADSLRLRFVRTTDRHKLRVRDLNEPCSLLEVMIALAIRMEEDIMADPKKGDRTGQWFWQMLSNLGLGAMTDNRYDEYKVETAIRKLLDRHYDRDGTGGLFRVPNAKKDMRRVEIWMQMLWYLDTIT